MENEEMEQAKDKAFNEVKLTPVDSLVMPIWVLQGSTGEYSDRTDWIVCAYSDEAKANSDCSKANDEAHKCFKALEEKDLRYPCGDADEAQERNIRAEILIVDPYAQFDYTGTSYWVVKCYLA